MNFPRKDNDDVAGKKPLIAVRVIFLIIDIICCLMTVSMIFLVATNGNVEKMTAPYGKESSGYLQYDPYGEVTQEDVRIAIVPYGEENLEEDVPFFLFVLFGKEILEDIRIAEVCGIVIAALSFCISAFVLMHSFGDARKAWKTKKIHSCFYV